MTYGNRRSFLNNLPLKWKKLGIFGFLILLFAVVYGINFRVFTFVQDISREKALLMDMLEDLLEARLAAMELRAGKSMDRAIEGVESNIRELSVDARARVGEEISDPDLRERLLGVIDGAELYLDRFMEAVAVQRELETVLDRMETLSDRLDAETDRLVEIALDSGDTRLARAAHDLDQKLATGRLMGERFLWRENPDRLARAKEALAAAARSADELAALAGGEVRSAAVAELADNVGLLATAVDAAADLTRRRAEVFTAELDQIGPQLGADLEAIMDSRFGTGNGRQGSAADSVRSLQTTLLVVSSAAVVLALLACFFLIRAVVRPIRALTDRLGALGDGDTDFEVRHENSLDEMGRMWTALGKLRATVETAYARAQVIDQLPNPVIVADPADDLKISYANRAARALFASIRGRQEPSGEELVGRPIEAVVGDRSDVRGVLRDASRLPWRARISYGGGEHADLTAAAVRGRKGQYIGAMLALRRTTEQVRSTMQFETDIKATVEQISTTFSGMRDRIETIARSAAEAQGRLAEGSDAVTEATASVQMVASAAEELSSSITEIASRLAESTRRATDASNNTADVARRAKELAAVSQRITEVVKTISDIADKTNLLALNATIEAASAGAAGKGFAVVAAEVKNLANQTAKATDEVSQEMAAIQTQIRNVTEGITAVADVIEEINGVFASISAAAEEQQAATREITVNAQHAAGGAETAARTIRLITDASAGNLNATRDLTRAARELAEANDNLARQSDAFLSTMKKTG